MLYLDPCRLRDLDLCSQYRLFVPGRRSSAASFPSVGCGCVESSALDPVEWERRQHHVTSTQQLGETLTNHRLKKKVSKLFLVRICSGGREILNVNLNHIASNCGTRHIEKSFSLQTNYINILQYRNEPITDKRKRKKRKMTARKYRANWK